MRVVPFLIAAGVSVSVCAGAVSLQPETKKAFDDYIRQIEAGMNADASAGRAAVVMRVPSIQSRLAGKESIAIPFGYRKPEAEANIPVPEGLINHWFGAIFIPGAKVEDGRAVLQDYPNYSRYYAPDVAESKLISRNGDNFDIQLRLHRQVRVKVMLGYSFPVEFNARYEVRYTNSSGMLRLRSISTRIAQLRDPKKSHTDEYPVDDGDGYLWRLYSYWRVYEGASQGKTGVYAECEAVSLSRSVPGFVERMVTYFTSNFPRDSMESTLEKTRTAVQARLQHR